MFATSILPPNKQRAAYAAEPVFSGRACSLLVEFSTDRRAPGGDSEQLGRVGGADRVPLARSARIQQKQGLNALILAAVARRPSHGLPRMADFCGFQAPDRLMASLQTRPPAGRSAAAQRRPAAPTEGGAVPPAPGRALPHPGSAAQSWKLVNRRPIAPRNPDRNETRLLKGPEIQSCEMGSGVWGIPARTVLARAVDRDGGGFGLDGGAIGEHVFPGGDSERRLGAGRG